MEGHESDKVSKDKAYDQSLGELRSRIGPDIELKRLIRFSPGSSTRKLTLDFFIPAP